MNCLIAGNNVKFLARTINFFSKIGDEVYFEATTSGLSLKVLNSSKTAFSIASFPSKYFIEFNRGTSQTNDFEENNCKVSIKPLLKIFKNIHQILTCKVVLNVEKSKIIFHFKCKLSVHKTHIINLLEYEHVSSPRVPDAYGNKITCDQKLFKKILTHFHSSIEELTFEVDKDKLVISNFIENLSRDKTTMRSKCILNREQFTKYDICGDANLTFCYKEFRAAANYADINKCDMEIFFDPTANVFQIRLSKTDLIFINLVMGTIVPLRSRRRRRDESTLNPVDVCNSELSEPVSKNATINANTSLTISNLPGDIENDENSHLFNSNRTSVRESRESNPIVRNIQKSQRNTVESMDVDDERPQQNTEIHRTDSEEVEIIFAGDTDETHLSSIQTKKTTQNQINNIEIPQRSNRNLLENTEKANNCDIVPVSPELTQTRLRRNARIRQIFRRCFDDTANTSSYPGHSQVFAESSDTEN
uniref:Putative dna repair protein rad9 n=1 Tax=Corethrella appendiculata TaxID=1370023 RepID=U5EFB3_9DIPT